MKIEVQTEEFQSYVDQLDIDLSIYIYYPHLAENQVLEITPTIISGTCRRELPMLQVNGHRDHKDFMSFLSKMGVRKIQKIYDIHRFMKNEIGSGCKYSYMHQIPYRERKFGSDLLPTMRHNTKDFRKK